MRAYYKELLECHKCDLEFQNIQEEIDELPGEFAFTRMGGIWLACDDGCDELTVLGPDCMP